VKLANSWIIMNPGGGPTPDKPGITVVDYEPGPTISVGTDAENGRLSPAIGEWIAEGDRFSYWLNAVLNEPGRRPSAVVDGHGQGKARSPWTGVHSERWERGLRWKGGTARDESG